MNGSPYLSRVTAYVIAPSMPHTLLPGSRGQTAFKSNNGLRRIRTRVSTVVEIFGPHPPPSAPPYVLRALESQSCRALLVATFMYVEMRSRSTMIEGRSALLQSVKWDISSIARRYFERYM